MNKEIKSWYEIENLAVSYYQDTKKGYGNTLKSRSKLQIDITNKIVENIQHYLSKIARSMCYGEGIKIINGKDIRRLSLKGIDLSIPDLIQQGSLEIIKTLKNYNPTKGSIINFITSNGSCGMYNHTRPLLSHLKIPDYIFHKARFIINENQDKKESIKKISHLKHMVLEIGYSSANLLYLGIENDFDEFNQSIDNGYLENSVSDIFYDSENYDVYDIFENSDISDIFLENDQTIENTFINSQPKDPCKKLELNELKKDLSKAFNNLPTKLLNIIKSKELNNENVNNIAKRYNVSTTYIYDLINIAKSKLKRGKSRDILIHHL